MPRCLVLLQGAAGRRNFILSRRAVNKPYNYSNKWAWKAESLSEDGRRRSRSVSVIGQKSESEPPPKTRRNAAEPPSRSSPRSVNASLCWIWCNLKAFEYYPQGENYFWKRLFLSLHVLTAVIISHQRMSLVGVSPIFLSLGRLFDLAILNK